MESTAVDPPAADVVTTSPASVSNATVDDAQQPTITGPLQEFLRSAVDSLRLSTGPDDEVIGLVCADLVTSYSSLDKVDRQTVDKQLVDILYLLTTRGLNVNVVCDVDKRRTILHVIASVPDSARFIRALHAAGAKMNTMDIQQQTALHIAATNANVNNVTTLIDCGAHVDKLDANKLSPLHLAAKGRRQIAVVRALIRGRAKVRQQDSAGHTPLHVAVMAGRVELVRELIVHGKASINGRDLAGLSAVHLAAIYDASGAVLSELLRHKSADVNARDCVAMETPLHKSVRLDMIDCVRLLLRHGADPNIANSAGATPLHLAATHLKDLTTWNMLISQSGGDCDAQTASGLTVRDMVVKAHNSLAKAVIAQFDAMRDPV